MADYTAASSIDRTEVRRAYRQDEEACIAACLASVQMAAHSDALGGEEVVIVVALDRCSDRTAAIVAACGVRAVVVQEGNVGLARAAGAAFVIGLGALNLPIKELYF